MIMSHIQGRSCIDGNVILILDTYPTPKLQVTNDTKLSMSGPAPRSILDSSLKIQISFTSLLK
jgi:hypothetical protein